MGFLSFLFEPLRRYKKRRKTRRSKARKGISYSSVRKMIGRAKRSLRRPRKTRRRAW